MENDLALQSTPASASASRAHPLRLGIIGCGYVTASSHLPAARLAPDIAVTALVDVRREMARGLAEQYQVAMVSSDYRDLFDQVDAVIVAVPHEMHAPVAVDFLDRGISVLVEKPMATSAADCRRMIQAADRSGAKLAVGMVRRFFDSSRMVKRMLESGLLGQVLHFEAQEAVAFDSFKASPFALQPPFGGVLFDTGPHTLDLLLWWLGDFASIDYQDDARGGVEANCRIDITTTQGVRGRVELSRTRRLENRITLECERGRVVFPTLKPDQVTIETDFLSAPMQINRVENKDEDAGLLPYFARQLSNFATAVMRDEPLEIPGEQGMRCIEAIEQCRQCRKTFPEAPWEAIHPGIV